MYYRSVKMIEVNNYIYIWVKKYFVDLSLHLISFLIKSQFNFGYLKSCVFFLYPTPTTLCSIDCPILLILSRYLSNILSAWILQHWLIGHPHVLLMHFHYIQLSGENKASEGAVPDVLEGSHPWVSGQTATRELKYLGANRFLPFVVRHSFHCRMYVSVCM